VEWIRRADLKQFWIFHFVAALIFARAGLEADASVSRTVFLKMRPRFFDNFDAELAMRNFNARDRAILTNGAKQAGFPVPASAINK
jgi:adenylate cyclase